ncbi:flagellar hook-associated protein FlgL [Marinospirillum insulare]|uniref:Flagellar hook-associated protein FlgL n=1 Tax=Marinospirillum insulare TaxID=217169 RepID=A0ABQ5ZT54_9GAMM|nr:flagellar hook-associated protein FlgL [Marinospirillum insulare]GLR63321.1 flagellar hook-associated protein FlgL [Marinospirillum insulare]
MIRLSTSQMYNNSMNSMLNSYSNLHKVNGQMSSGKRVLTPADDPVAAAQTLNTKTRMAVVQQYNRNIDFADKNLSLTESTLDQTESSLIKLKELAIKLGSDQWSDEQVKASGIEVKEMLSHLQGLVNTRNESGEYIYAGSQAEEKAYNGNTFVGDAIEREAQAADDTFIKMLTSGARAFEKLDTAKLATHDSAEAIFTNDGSQDLTATPKEYSNNMLGVIQYFVDATGNGAAGDPVNKEAIRSAIQNIDVAFEQVAQTRSQIGARQNTLEAVKNNNLDFEAFAEKSISELEDLDYADAAVRLEQSMLSYQAGMQVTGKISGLSLFNYI